MTNEELDERDLVNALGERGFINCTDATPEEDSGRTYGQMVTGEDLNKSLTLPGGSIMVVTLGGRVMFFLMRPGMMNDGEEDDFYAFVAQLFPEQPSEERVNHPNSPWPKET